MVDIKTKEDLNDYLLENGLLEYLVSRVNSGQKNWFGFPEQRITGIALAHAIATNHADKFTPDEAVKYAMQVNDACFHNIIKSNK